MAKKETSPDDMITTAEAGVELGVTTTRVVMLINEGRLRATRFGQVWAIRRGDLDAVRHRRTGRPPGPRNPPEDPKKPDPKKKKRP